MRSASRQAIGRIAMLCTLAAGSVACGDAFFAPGAKLPASLSFSMTGAVGGAAEAFDQANAASVQVRRGEAMVLDTVVALTPGAAEQRVQIPVPLASEKEQLSVTVKLRRGSDPLFQWHGVVGLEQGQTAEIVAPLQPVITSVQAPDSVLLTAIGDSVRMHATGFFATGDTMSTSLLEWTSINGAATVGAGVVVSRDNGIARVVVRGGSSTDTVRVRVQQAVHSIRPATMGDSVFTGFRTRFVAFDRRGVEIRTPVTWTTADTGTARVAQNGAVQGKDMGLANITASSAGTQASVAVRVVPTPRASVQAGAHHTCGLADSGTVHCWGTNDRGVLGTTAAPWIGSTQAHTAATGVTFESIAVGAHMNCGLTASGAAYCWGLNISGSIGDGSTTPQWPFAEPAARQVAGGHSFKSIAVGGGWPQTETHACGVAMDGQAYCWGGNGFGQLGNGSTTASPIPVPVAGGLRFESIAADFGFTCATVVDGPAYCWGLNDEGQLGSGSTIPSSVPVEVSGGRQFARIDLGNAHACAVTPDHEMFCWGRNGVGALGAGSNGGGSQVPVAVAPQLRFISVTAGYHHSCGTTANAAAYCWGDNHTGRLGTGTALNTNVPTRVAASLSFGAISAGDSHTCAVTTTGSAFCWGDRGHAQLGSGTFGIEPRPVPVGDGRVYTSITAGYGFSCGVAGGGAAFCWGINVRGQLGNGGQARDGFSRPTAVAGGLTFQSVAAGMYHVCGVAVNGAAHCWGSNEFTQLGAGITDARRTTPVAVSGGIVFTMLSSGRAHSCGIATDGRAFCWGANDGGQLGDGSTTSRSVPTAVSGSHTFSSISAGDSHTCGVTTAGSGYCWGDNAVGQLGTGTQASSLVPAAVAGASAFSEIGSSRNFTDLLSYSCGVTVSGDIQCWGTSEGCRLGNGICDPRLQLTPASVQGGLSGFTSIAPGGPGACAVRNDGSAVCWGSNWNGELGIGFANEPLGSTNTDPGSARPLPTASGLAFAEIASAPFHRCGITTAGAAYCWGAPEWGTLGNGTVQWVLTPTAVETALRFR